MDALKAAKQAVADKDILYTGQELRNILANLIDFYEAPRTFTYSVPEFRNDQLDYSCYKKL